MIIPTNIDGNETELCNYTYTPSHRYISRTWYVQYRGIQRACVIIDRLTDTDIGNESEKKRILGEAYFLRAFYYFHLVRLSVRCRSSTTKLPISQWCRLKSLPWPKSTNKSSVI